MTIPKNTVLYDSLKSAYFGDSFSTKMKYDNQSALDVYFIIANNTPNWVRKLMVLRNWIVSKLGLKHLGAMDNFDNAKLAEDYKSGDNVGIFNLVANTKHEVVLEDRDKHLDVRISFLIVPDGEVAAVHATTIVHVHNIFGKLYMFFVGPIHKIIVPSSLKQLPQA